ncbi:hypothetical protein Droror1_Dr00012314 [Drosera rotundifolia]
MDWLIILWHQTLPAFVHRGRRRIRTRGAGEAVEDSQIRSRARASGGYIEGEDLPKIVRLRKPLKTPYGRLLAMAAHSLAAKQNKPEPRGLWEQPRGTLVLTRSSCPIHTEDHISSITFRSQTRCSLLH